MADSSPKFIADGNLKPLAKRLRMLGLDCVYDGGASLPDLIQSAAHEDRVLLTLKPVAKTNRVKVFRLPGDNPDLQLQQVNEVYDLLEFASPFRRCLVCNTQLEEAHRSVQSLPDSVSERGLTVYQCPSCERYYWPGSHLERMREQLARSGIILPQME